MERVQDFDLASAAHVALERNQPPSAWDARLRQAVGDALIDHHHRENRFLLALVAGIAVLSLVVDAIAAPHAFAKVASFRLAAVLPLAIPGLFLPRSRMGLQKILIGLSVTGFAVSIAYASQFVSSPANALLTLVVVTLMGLALPALPFRR